MPRKRDINPDIWRSEQFLDLPSAEHQLLFIACISLADDLGIGRVSDLRRHTGIDTIDLDPIESGRLLVTYAEREGGETVHYYLLPTWCRHQFVKKPSPPKLPLPSNWKELIPERFHPKYQPCRAISLTSRPPVDHQWTTPPSSLENREGVVPPALSLSPVDTETERPCPSPSALDEKPKRAKRPPTEAEKLISKLGAELDHALGCRMAEKCRIEVAALISKHGYTEDRVRAAIKAKAQHPKRPWDWAKEVIGYAGPNGRGHDVPRGPAPPPLFRPKPVENCAMTEEAVAAMAAAKEARRAAGERKEAGGS